MSKEELFTHLSNMITLCKTPIDAIVIESGFLDSANITQKDLEEVFHYPFLVWGTWRQSVIIIYPKGKCDFDRLVSTDDFYEAEHMYDLNQKIKKLTLPKESDG
jgi:hypothetical protein